MVKQGGTSANTSTHGRPMKSRKKCPDCGRDYAMDWALNNHVKACRTFNNALEKWQKENKGKWGLK